MKIVISVLQEDGVVVMEFSTQRNGRAHAITQAIEYLAAVQLPLAIERDHIDHGRDRFPIDGFGKPEER